VSGPVRLRALGRYVNEPRGLAFDAGTEFDAEPAMLAFLLADAPGTFEQVLAKAATAPPADKAIKAPDKAK
jgi:hypothetical protein